MTAVDGTALRTASPAVDAVALLRQRLADTREQPRRIARMDLPASVEKLLTPELLAGLRPAAVLIPVLCHAGGETILLTRRAETLREHNGQISFPGGRRDETDASLADTALREAHEEVGLPPSQVEVIGYLDDYPTLTGYRITPVVGLVTPPFTAVTDAAEVAAAFELPFDRVLSDEHFIRKTLMHGTTAMPVRELQHQEYRIWGATAAILWHLHRLLTGPSV